MLSSFRTRNTTQYSTAEEGSLFSGVRQKKKSQRSEVTIAVIEKELEGSGSFIGYRQMHQRLRVDYGLVVSKETVRLAWKHLDPGRVERRSRHKLKRTYSAKGPIFIRPLDGYDKFKAFRFQYSWNYGWLQPT